MPLIAPSDLRDIVAPVLDGRLEIVLWGLHDGADLAEWQLGLPVGRLVDTERAGRFHGGRPIEHPDILAGLDPARIVVLFNYYYISRFSEYVAWMDRLGLRYFAPTPLALACGLDRPPADPAALAGRHGPALDPWRCLDQLLRRLRPRRPGGNGRHGVALALVRLEVGGAERQVCALAAGLAGRGITANLATLWPDPPETAHYRRILDQAGVRSLLPAEAGPADTRRRAVLADTTPEAAAILWHLPPHLAWQVFQYLGLFKVLRPAAVICYLDLPNVLAGLAAVLADVPTILLSGRNLNPTRFPHFFGGQCPDLYRLYRLLLGRPGVVLSTNSTEGAASYAGWLDIAADAVPVIPNAVAAWATAEPPRPIPAGPPRILGLFRLSPEKRPLDFVDTIARLSPAFPGLRATICGDGRLRGAVAARIAALGLEPRIELAGAIDDVAGQLRRSHLLLHTAEAEGLPNVLLEAQSLGVPVVASRTPGALEALAPALHPRTAAIGDIAGLAASAAGLLADPAGAARLGGEASRHVRDRFTTDALVDRTLAALSRPDGGQEPGL